MTVLVCHNNGLSGEKSRSFVTRFGKTEHNARLLIFSYRPMFAKNIFFGEEAFFTPSYNMKLTVLLIPKSPGTSLYLVLYEAL